MRWLCALAFVCVASVSAAQTIHQYPYDPTVTAYGPALPYPNLSAQCHWRPSNAFPDPTPVPQLQSPSLGHTHLEVKGPIYGEFTGNFSVPFTLMLFHTAGRIHPDYPLTGQLLDWTHATWDTPDGKQPVMVGDPTGLKMWSGHVTVDFSKAQGDGHQGSDIPAHGWFGVAFQTVTLLDNGDTMGTTLTIPFYSIRDPSQPEVFMPQDPGASGTQCVGHGAGQPEVFGAQVVKYTGILPILAPILGPVGAPVSLSNYQTVGLPVAQGQTRADMDLHNGNPGRLLQAMAGDPIDQHAIMPSPFDPALLGSGVHKVAAMWEQDTGDGSFGLPANQQVSALFVVSVTVGTPPPTTAPTLGSISPNQGTQGTVVPVTLMGSNFVSGGTTVAVSGTGVVVSGVTVSGTTMLTATFTLSPTALVGARSVTVTTAGGTSAGQPFTVNQGTPAEVWSTWLLQHGNVSGNLRACPDASGVGCVGVMKN